MCVIHRDKMTSIFNVCIQQKLLWLLYDKCTAGFSIHAGVFSFFSIFQVCLSLCEIVRTLCVVYASYLSCALASQWNETEWCGALCVLTSQFTFLFQFRNCWWKPKDDTWNDLDNYSSFCHPRYFSWRYTNSQAPVLTFICDLYNLQNYQPRKVCCCGVSAKLSPTIMLMSRISIPGQECGELVVKHISLVLDMFLTLWCSCQWLV